MNWTTKPIYQPNEIQPHLYMPDYQAMGDCRICGHEQDKPWHKIAGSEPIKPTLTINEDGPLGKAGDFTIEWVKTFKERANKVPTHDPYTNPNAHIYYSCDCGNILDPGTKSFAELNNVAMNAGWKIRWGHEYYEPFCPTCVMMKGIE